MRIVGRWLTRDDGITRPTVRASVRDRDNRLLAEDFLIDSGADRSAFSEDFWRRLRMSGERPSAGSALLGVGGATAFVLIDTVIEFALDDGRPATVRGEFAAFTDPHATDLSILGRDVLDHFDVILSRRRDEILLLAPTHQYRVARA